MLRNAIVVAAIAVAVFNPTIANGHEHVPSAEEFDRLADRFQQTLDTLQSEYGFTGGIAAFILPDGRVSVAATGLAEVESRRPMQHEDLLFTGSIGKTFVSAVALQLSQEGVLDLDAPISAWFEDDAWFTRLPNGSGITLRHLLSHRAGLQDHLDQMAFGAALMQRVSTGRIDTPFAPDQLVRYILRKPPLGAPGESFHYTDTGYILAGMIIERATGNTLYEEIQRRVLDPLALTSTRPANAMTIPGLVPGYLADDNPFPVPRRSMDDTGRLTFHPQTEWAGGGFVSNPGDLVRWAKALYSDRILGESATAELLDGKPTRPDEPQSTAYGLGVTIAATPYGTGYGHGGTYPGYHGMMMYFVDRDFAIAFQLNQDDLGIRDAMLSALARPVVTALAQSSSP